MRARSAWIVVASLACSAACGSSPAGEVADAMATDAVVSIDGAATTPDGGADASVADGSVSDGAVADAYVADSTTADATTAPDAAAPDAMAIADAAPPPDTLEDCTLCHGEVATGSPAPPFALGGSSDTTYRGVGAHRSHLGDSTWHREVKCEYCHPVPATIHAPLHLGNPPADMIFTDLATATVWTSAAAPTCTSYCHGATLSGGLATVPVWTVVNDSQKQCDSCHGNPPAIAPHSPYTTDCGRCHDPMVAGSQTFDQPERHIDGNLDVSAANDCVSCHDSPQGPRRQISGAGGDFARASHHVSGLIQNSDCVVCHDQSAHWSGQVRLKNADNPTTIVTLTGNPATSAVEAVKLESFCLSCHDADGAAGGVPFTDGIMPPVIDAAGWGAASHKGSALTCAGDGESFGCHDNGHGSSKRKLLAPADASQTPVAGDPLREEEGMCYSCHAAAAMATSDVEAAFGLASHHPVSALEQGGGARVECSNCHDPHLARTSARLIDPDSGAAWPSVNYTDFCLRCHDGSPPTGVVFSSTGTADGSGYDKSSYVGTPHDQALGSGAAYGCLHCHDRHGSTHQATLVATYVTNDYNNYTPPDYQLCFNCHTPLAVIANPNAFEDLHQKHVSGEDAPCIICHDPHVAADPAEPGLINFSIADNGSYDFSYSGSATNPSNAFWQESNGDRSCRLRCHGETHSPLDYDPTADGPVDTTTPGKCAACHP